MTTHEKALQLASERIADVTGCTIDAEDTASVISAYLSALLPEDAAGQVERLRTPADRYCTQSVREEAASLIQSQAARIAELEAGVSEFADPDNWTVGGRFDPHSGNFGATTFARSLLNGERKEEPQPTNKPNRRDDWHYDSDGYCDNPGRGY